MPNAKYPLALKEYRRDMRQLHQVAAVIILLGWLGLLVYPLLAKQNDPVWRGLSEVLLVSSALSVVLLWQNQTMLARRLKVNPPESCVAEIKYRLNKLSAHRQRLYPGMFVVILVFLTTAVFKSMRLCGMMAAATLFTALVFSFILLEQWITAAFYHRIQDGDFNASG